MFWWYEEKQLRPRKRIFNKSFGWAYNNLRAISDYHNDMGIWEQIYCERVYGK